MAQNNTATTIPTDNLVGKRMFVGNTTPAYPVTGDVWVDNSFATVGTQGTQGLQGITGTGTQGAQGFQGPTSTTYTAPTIGSTSIPSGTTVTTIAGVTLTGATITTATKVQSNQHTQIDGNGFEMDIFILHLAGAI
jgi:hypothetical protein